MSIGIWNSLDELALYIGIERLPKENDESFRSRIYQTSRYMYKNDSYSIIKSIAAQCGMKVKPLLQIDSDRQFKFSINYDYMTLETENSYVRKFIGRDSIEFYELEDILKTVDDISLTRIYDPRELEATEKDITVKYVIKNTNVKSSQEFIYNTSVTLLNTNIINGSIEFEDVYNYSREVVGLQNIKAKGDYFVDYTNGYIKSYSCSDNGQIVKYRYIEKPFIIECCELAMTPINQLFKHGLTTKAINSIEFLLQNNIWS